MRIATLTLSLITLSLAGCTTTGQQANKEVDAVVIDEAARAEAAKVARKTGDSSDALKAAAEVSTREPATTPQ